MNRSIHKNLETLRKLQAERKAQYEKDRAEEIILAATVNSRRHIISHFPVRIVFSGIFG